jgi:hypothetical protein
MKTRGFSNVVIGFQHEQIAWLAQEQNRKDPAKTIFCWTILPFQEAP